MKRRLMWMPPAVGGPACVALMLGILAVASAAWAQTGPEAWGPMADEVERILQLGEPLTNPDAFSLSSVAGVAYQVKAFAGEPEKLSDPARRKYYRTMSYGMAAADDIPGALSAAQQWARLEPASPVAARRLMFLYMLSGDTAKTAEALRALAQPQHAKWKPWVDYMGRLLPLLGTKPAMAKLPLSDGSQFDLSAIQDKAVLLYFWAAGPARPSAPGVDGLAMQCLKIQSAMAGAAQGKLVVVGINLDSPENATSARAPLMTGMKTPPQYFLADNPQVSPAPKPFDIKDVPTAVVLAGGGTVVFVGDGRGVELQLAVRAAATKAQEAINARMRLMGDGEMGPGGFGDRMMPRMPGMGPGPGPGPGPGMAPGAAERDETEAKRLYDDAESKMILHNKTREPSLRAQAVEGFRKCAADYPNTPSGKRAKEQLDMLQSPATP
jgi:hypothetical protein